MSGKRIVLLVFGIIIVLGGLVLLVSGVPLILVNHARVDSQGFISSDTLNLDKDSYAIVVGPTDSIMGGSATLDALQQMNVGTIKIEGENNDASKEIFLGVIEKADLDQYLGNVEYDEVINIDEIVSSGLDATYNNNSGTSNPTAPAGQTFWTASVSGTGAQTLEWKPEKGSYWIVVMNNDGSVKVDADVKLGVKVGSILLRIGIGLAIAGVLLMIIGGLMIFFSFRGRKKSSKPQPEVYTMVH